MVCNGAQRRYAKVSNTGAMAGKKNPRQLEKLISYILGRRPDEFGLVPDDEGYVRLKDLLRAISEESGWGYVRRSHIDGVLATSVDRPFVLENDKIRAVADNHRPKTQEGVVPPKLLFHCVRARAYPIVCKEGILPSRGPRVVLAATRELAMRIGRRRDPDPVLLTVHALKAHEAGAGFSMHGDLLYTAEKVPVGFFSGPPLPKEKAETPESRKKPDAAAGRLPGSFFLDLERSGQLQRQRPREWGHRKEIEWKKDLRRAGRKRRR